MPKKKKAADIDPMVALMGAPEGEPKSDEPLSPEKQIEALVKTVDTLTKGLEGLEVKAKQSHDLSMSLLAAPVAPTTPAAIAVVPGGISEADLAALPDPAENPEGYSKALNALIAGSVQTQIASFQDQTTAAATADTTQANKVSALWERFQDANPDLADHEDLVEVAARKVVQKAISRGLDGDKFMFGAGSERFLEDVADHVNATLATIRDVGEDGKPGEKKDKDGENQPDPALGILPGMPALGAGADPAKQAEEAAGGLVADLKEDQRKTGFF